MDEPFAGQQAPLSWPIEGWTRVPYWVYTDEALYKKELDRFFYGPMWNYVGLECEIPAPGDYRRVWIGEREVLVVRDKSGAVNVLENRCGHRGARLVWKPSGNVKSFVCAYHQWNFSLSGAQIGIPFKRGALGQGGMPADFDANEFSLGKLRTHVEGGAIWATFDHAAPSFADFCGPGPYEVVKRLFNTRPLRLVGYSRQLIKSNWKMYIENLKDPYHATLLHTFFITFGLWRADSKSESVPSGTGHSVMTSRNEGKKTSDATTEMTSFKNTFEMRDRATVTQRREFEDAKVGGPMIFPSVVLQQQANTLAMRHIIPKGPGAFELEFTFFGYEDDDDEMRRLRLRHANLMGPAGFVSMEDGEVLVQTQHGAEQYPHRQGVLELGGRDTEPVDHMVTEVMIRAFWKFYKEAMAL